jgi:hypothetical protein
MKKKMSFFVIVLSIYNFNITSMDEWYPDYSHYKNNKQIEVIKDIKTYIFPHPNYFEVYIDFGDFSKNDLELFLIRFKQSLERLPNSVYKYKNDIDLYDIYALLEWQFDYKTSYYIVSVEKEHPLNPLLDFDKSEKIFKKIIQNVDNLLNDIKEKYSKYNFEESVIKTLLQIRAVKTKIIEEYEKEIENISEFYAKKNIISNAFIKNNIYENENIRTYEIFNEKLVININDSIYELLIFIKKLHYIFNNYYQNSNQLSFKKKKENDKKIKKILTQLIIDMEFWKKKHNINVLLILNYLHQIQQIYANKSQVNKENMCILSLKNFKNPTKDICIYCLKNFLYNQQYFSGNEMTKIKEINIYNDNQGETWIQIVEKKNFLFNYKLYKDIQNIISEYQKLMKKETLNYNKNWSNCEKVIYWLENKRSNEYNDINKTIAFFLKKNQYRLHEKQIVKANSILSLDTVIEIQKNLSILKEFMDCEYKKMYHF